jgi:hypothetical protein
MCLGTIFRRLGACFLGVFMLIASLRVDLRTGSETLVFDGTPWFVDVTEEIGLDFTHDAGPLPTDEHYFTPQIVGSGAALFDFDNSGRLGLLLLQNGGPNSSSTNRLYRQGADGRFVDVSQGSGLDVAGYGMGVAIGDVNNDGLPDVLITEYGRIRLFLNLGGGKFTDITKQAGLGNPAWATGACFFDYDRDGWLDLVVVNYPFDPARVCTRDGRPDYCAPLPEGGTPAQLYRNLGRGAGGAVVRFEDVSAKSGLGALPGNGLGVLCADFDGDGWPDIFVANDAQANRLWINRHDGTFVEEALWRGVALNGRGWRQGNMGIALGDVAGEGLLDLFVTHLDVENHILWKQGPRGQYQDRTEEAGLTTRHWRGVGWGTVLADFNHDGALDLAVVNGQIHRIGDTPVHRDAGTFWTDFEERNQLFVNDGKGRFRDISLENAPFCKPAAVSRGLACGDLDGDGALDLVVTCLGGKARVYRNVAPNRGHWLMVRAVDPALGGRDAYGAEVTVTAGKRRWLRLINPGHSFLCSNDPRAHFGLGKAEQFDAIRVVWPDGKAEDFPGQAADRAMVLRKGEGHYSENPKLNHAN